MKRSIYNFLVRASELVLWPTQFFNPKLKLFVEGRKGIFDFLEQQLSSNDKTIWFHCASLGEYEQGLPIMEAMKKECPDYKIVLSFFSPSGYEVRKNTSAADVVCYLPLDTKAKAKRFIDIVSPSLAFFVKYEFWPNYLFELKKQGIPTFLVSGVFRENQTFFKSRGSLLRDALLCFDHFFLQNQKSLELLKTIGISNASVTGDTRFDRVSRQIEINNQLDFMDLFKGDSLCLVCGSSWPEDEEVLLPFLNSELGQSIKTVIAPHKIDQKKITELETKLQVPLVVYSKKDHELLSQAQVLIIDTVGLLTKIYSYADIAYVGGAMGSTGLHNILEPATFGVPVVIGKNFDNFPEAQKLEDIAGLFSVSTPEESEEILSKLVTDKQFREKTGMICGHFVNSNTGATRAILDYLKNYLPN